MVGPAFLFVFESGPLMEPIIRNPAVASEARQLRRPHAEQAHAAQPVARETAFANLGTEPAFSEEKKSGEMQNKPVIPNDPPPVDEEAELKRRLENEKALADAQALAEKRGYAVGLEKGEEEARKTVTEQGERLSSVMAALYRAKADAIQDSEDEMVEIVYTAVCKIIGEVAFTPEAVAGVVRRVAAMSRDRDQLTARLHPEDFELVQKTLSQA